MTAEEAVRQAQAEGLTLHRSVYNASGYQGVSFSQKTHLMKPYKAEVRLRGMEVRLGQFATAEEAALSVARVLEGYASAVLAEEAADGRIGRPHPRAASVARVLEGYAAAVSQRPAGAAAAAASAAAAAAAPSAQAAAAAAAANPADDLERRAEETAASTPHLLRPSL